MTAQEYENWSTYMRAQKGKWTVDPIHNGDDGRNFLAFVPSPEDETKGVYVQIFEDGRVSSGEYEGAIPHIGEASFRSHACSKFANFNEAVTYTRERLQLSRVG